MGTGDIHDSILDSRTGSHGFASTAMFQTESISTTCAAFGAASTQHI
jgi:hypothetical protein